MLLASPRFYDLDLCTIYEALFFAFGLLISRMTWLCTVYGDREEPLEMQSGAFVTLMSPQFSLPALRGGCWFEIDEVVKSLEKWLFSLVSIWGTLLLSVQLSWGFQVIQCLQLCSTTKDGWAYFTRTMKLNLIHHLIHKILVQTCCFKVCNC